MKFHILEEGKQQVCFEIGMLRWKWGQNRNFGRLRPFGETMPLPGASRAPWYLILTVVLWSRWNQYLHFTDEKTKVWRG